MALDWRDIRDQKIAIVPALDNEGRKIAIARAGNDMDGRPLWYGCYWSTFKQVGDLSCGSRYFPPCDVFFDDDGDGDGVGVAEPETCYRNISRECSCSSCWPAISEPRAEAVIELEIRRVIGSLQSAALMGVAIDRYTGELETLRLAMKTRVNFDFDAELNAE